MPDQNAVVAIYDTHIGAEDAVKELQRAGIDMSTLSIIGKDTHTDEHAVGYYNTGDRMKRWGKTGAFWGGFWDYYSVRRSLPFLASGRYWWRVPRLRGSWLHWKAPRWLEA